MSWYRRVDIRMEGDRRFKRLTRPQPNGQSLWRYLLTGMHAATGVPGLYAVTREGMASRLKWKLDAFDKCWAELEVVHDDDDAVWPMAIADWDEGVVWTPNAVTYNLPNNINIVKGWMNQVDAIPECYLRDAWLYGAALTLEKEKGPAYIKPLAEWFGKPLPERFPKPLAERFRNGIANTQRQRQRQRQEGGRPELPLAPDPTPPAVVVVNMPMCPSQRVALD